MTALESPLEYEGQFLLANNDSPGHIVVKLEHCNGICIHIRNT